MIVWHSHEKARGSSGFDWHCLREAQGSSNIFWHTFNSTKLKWTPIDALALWSIGDHFPSAFLRFIKIWRKNTQEDGTLLYLFLPSWHHCTKISIWHAEIIAPCLCHLSFSACIPVAVAVVSYGFHNTIFLFRWINKNRLNSSYRIIWDVSGSCSAAWPDKCGSQCAVVVIKLSPTP